MKLSNPSWQEIIRWRQQQRKRLVALRQSLSAEEHERRSKAIAAFLDRTLKDQNAETVSLYWPIKGEPDLRPLMHRLCTQGLKIALPVVIEKDQPLGFREWMPDSMMELGIWNIPIPAEGQLVQPTHVVAPFVGFDAQGYRLGYGGGFYDRTLVLIAPRPCFIGVGYSESALESIYPQEHDVVCNVIITDKEIIEIA